MLKKMALAFLVLLTFGQLALVALPVYAQATPDPGADALKGLNDTGLGGTSTGPANAGSKLPMMVGQIIRILIGLLGIIFVVLMVYAGFKWMTARGETEPIDEAKNTIKNSIIGLIIILMAYAITGFVIDKIINATK